MDQDHFRIEMPNEFEVLIGSENGVRVVHTGDVLPKRAPFLGARLRPGYTPAPIHVKIGMPVPAHALIYVGLGIWFYTRWGGLGIVALGLLDLVLGTLLKNSLAIARQKAAQTKQSH